MAEKTIQLSGPSAVIVGVILLCVVGVRLLTFGNNTDKDLRESVERQLMSEFYPSQVKQLSSALNVKDGQVDEASLDKVLDAKLDIHKVQTSFPFLDFSSPRIVIVKVVYSLGDGAGEKEKYFSYKYGAIGNAWQYKRESSVVSYYLNLF